MNATRIGQGFQRRRLSLDPETRKPKFFSEFRAVDWLSGRKNKLENPTKLTQAIPT
jgi:hypothetical protein